MVKMKRTVLALLEVDDNINNGQVVDTAFMEINLNCHKHGVDCLDALATDEDSDDQRERYLHYLIKWIYANSDDPNTSPISYEEFLKNER